MQHAHSGSSPLRNETDRSVARTGDRHFDAQAVTLDVDLEPPDPLTKRRDVLVEGSHFLARACTLQRGAAARPSHLALSGEILLGDPLNDLSPFLHAIQELRLQVDQPRPQMRELMNRAELFRPVREEVRIVDDWHDVPPGIRVPIQIHANERPDTAGCVKGAKA